MEPKQTKKLVLIIDDNEDAYKIISRIISNYYNTEYCDENSNFTKQITKLKPDCILLDQHMGSIDGTKVLKNLKTNKITQRIPVIMMTGDSNPEIIILCMKNDADDYLIKGKYDQERILHALEQVIKKASLKKKISEQQKEKELLLYEMNHRVKNNLNVIISLLNLKSDAISNGKDANEAFGESRDLIYSMAMVHEKLYQSTNFTEINIKNYLENLLIQLIDIYQPYNKIKSILEITDVNMNINKAVPFGMIITELVTNALKHAYNNTENGILEIICIKSETGNFNISVKDNGSGLPGNIKIENPESSGLELVNILTSQIHGQIYVERENGTKFLIDFPE